MRHELGCCADELEVGDEFSHDGGVTWITAVTVHYDQYTNSVIINCRDDSGKVDTMIVDTMECMLLQRDYGKVKP